MPPSDRPPTRRAVDPAASPSPAATRRQVLVALAALTTGGCGLRLESPPPSPTPAAPSGDELARLRAAADVDRLLALAAAVPRRGGAGPALSAVATAHRAHLVALRPGTPATPNTPTTPTTPTGTATGRPGSVRTLAGAEREVAARLRAQLAPVGGPTARLLASVAAACTVHADLLEGR